MLCYFHHSKDEYNHTESFLSLLSYYGKHFQAELLGNTDLMQSVIKKGYVSRKGYLVEIMPIKDFIAMYILMNC